MRMLIAARAEPFLEVPRLKNQPNCSASSKASVLAAVGGKDEDESKREGRMGLTRGDLSVDRISGIPSERKFVYLGNCIFLRCQPSSGRFAVSGLNTMKCSHVPPDINACQPDVPADC